MPTPNTDPFVGDKLRKTSHSQVHVTKEHYLARGEEVISALIPAAVGDAYNIILPPVAACPGVEIIVTGKRAADYSNGTMKVVDREDALNPTRYQSDDLTADGDYVIVKNCGGRYWIELSEQTT